MLFFILLSGCATEPQKTHDEYVLPALSAQSADNSLAESPETAAQDTGHVLNGNQPLINKDATGQKEKDRAVPAVPGRGSDAAASGKSGEKISGQKTAKFLPSEKMDFRIQNGDLVLLLRSLARIGNISIMISENVKGNATIDIQNKPWDQIFTGLLRTHGLMYEWEGDIIRVMTIEDIGQDVRELELRQKREEQKRGIETVAPFATAVIRIEYTDANNLKEIFEKFLDAGTNVRRGIVMVDKHSNSLIVQAREKEIGEMLLLAKKLDRPTRQIRIEAQIIEANSDTARELGIEWGGSYSGSIGGGRKLWLTPNIDSLVTGEDDNNTASTAGTSDSTGTAASGSSSILMQKLPSVLAVDSGLFIGAVAEDAGKYLLGIQLSALEEEGKIRILSNPSISTLDNHTALIESGREVPYQTVEDDEVNIEFKKAALSLEVTPHVIEDSFLKMKIITSKDELDFSNSVEGNPTVITKKAQTDVILRDGQTMVIGGLRKETENRGQSGVPVLKDIPLLGNLFKKEYRSSSREEILIFITPRIVK
ncbi:MAG: type IV pilus secretin PilQ [Desulfococcaceae bacterium]